MDKIFLNNLLIDTIIGIYGWERETLQTLRFDFEFDWDIRQAASSDDIKDTLDYGAVASRVVEFVSASRFQLIETLAEKVAALLLAEFPVHHLKLTLSKPVLIHGQNQAQIQIQRTRT